MGRETETTIDQMSEQEMEEWFKKGSDSSFLRDANDPLVRGLKEKGINFEEAWGQVKLFLSNHPEKEKEWRGGEKSM